MYNRVRVRVLCCVVLNLSLLRVNNFSDLLQSVQIPD